MANFSPFEDFLNVLWDIMKYMKDNKTKIKIYLQKVDESNIEHIIFLAKFDEIFTEKIEILYSYFDCYPNFDTGENKFDDDEVDDYY